MQVDGTPHYLKMLEVIAAFGVVTFSARLPGEMGQEARVQRQVERVAKRTVGWGWPALEAVQHLGEGDSWDPGKKAEATLGLSKPQFCQGGLTTVMPSQDQRS